VPWAKERPAASTPAVVRKFRRDGGSTRVPDALATEEPLEIRLTSGTEERVAALTMRTPGNDFDLAAGFLYSEGILAGKDDLYSVRYCQPPEEQQYNVVTVDLRGGMPELAHLDRHFLTTSACGVCGKASLDHIAELGGPPLGAGPVVSADLLLSLPARLAAGQRVFARTGGLHAAALFDAEGDLLCVREDVGRHNAMDKLVGWALLSEKLPLTDRIVMVSGRASFELVQKAVRAGAPIFCAVSAPSSLAVDVVRRFGMTLVGFLREDGFTAYAGETRIGGGSGITRPPEGTLLEHRERA
jgi:FdhD protein